MALAGDAPLNVRVDTWAQSDLYDARDVTRSEHPDRAGQVRWSWSTLSSLITCPRKFQLGVLSQVAPADMPQALRVGIAVHTGMETFWRRVLWEDSMRSGDDWRADAGRLGAVVAAARDDATGIVENDPRLEAIDRFVAIKVVRNFGYETAHMQVRQWRPLWIEGVLAVDLGALFSAQNPNNDDDALFLSRTLPQEVFGPPPWPADEPLIPWEARPDLVIESAGERPGVWVVDHKTMSRVRASELRAYTQDGQVLGNLLACRLSRFPQATGFVVDLLGKADVPSFFHGFVEPADALLREFAVEVARRQQQYRRFVAEGFWPRSFTRGACVDQYGACDFFDPCSEGRGADSLVSGTYPGFTSPAAKARAATVDPVVAQSTWERWFGLSSGSLER